MIVLDNPGSLEIRDSAYISAEPEIRISRYNSLHFSGETSTRGAEWFKCFPVSDSG